MQNQSNLWNKLNYWCTVTLQLVDLHNILLLYDAAQKSVNLQLYINAVTRFLYGALFRKRLQKKVCWKWRTVSIKQKQTKPYIFSVENSTLISSNSAVKMKQFREVFQTNHTFSFIHMPFFAILVLAGVLSLAYKFKSVWRGDYKVRLKQTWFQGFCFRNFWL